MGIQENVRRILQTLPSGVQLVAAAKNRQPVEIMAAVDAGISIIGENYVQEAEAAYRIIGHRVAWHFIGKLQMNKVKKAVSLFDMIETVDSTELAREIDRRCEPLGKVMPVLLEVNSGRESRKSGVLPEQVAALAREIARLPRIRVMGLMTMGAYSGDPEDMRSWFSLTRQTLDNLKGLHLPNADLRYLSMGMTDSYRVALEEGANIVRIGTGIFGEKTRPA